MDTSLVPEIARLNITFTWNQGEFCDFPYVQHSQIRNRKSFSSYFLFPPQYFYILISKQYILPVLLFLSLLNLTKAALFFFFQDFVEFNETHKTKILDSQNPESWSKPTISTHSSGEQIVLGLTENNLLRLHRKLH